MARSILPRMLVFPRREITSLKTDPPPENLQTFPVIDGWEALHRAWSVDAHMVMYDIRGEKRLPRISKRRPAFAWLRKQKLTVIMRWVVLDIDTPGHKSWDETPASWWIHQLAAINESPDARKAGWYKTRSGYHLIWTLKPVVSPEDWERYVAALRARLRRDGIAINEECKDWTRLMRLPRIIRDGEQIELPMSLDNIGELNLIGQWDPEKTGGLSEKISMMQDWDRVSVSKDLENHLKKGLPFGNTKKNRLEKYGEQGRDTIILSVAGTLLRSMEQPNPEVVTRLMLPSVLASRRDDPQQISDRETLYSRVLVLAEKEKESRSPDIFKDVDDAVTLSNLPLVVAPRANQKYYVLDDRTGGYVGPHSSEHVAKAVLDLCPSRSARAVGERGAPRDGKRIFHEDGEFCDRIILKAGASVSEYNKRTSTLYEACAQWSPLKPRFDHEIDRWLKLLGGGRSDKLLDWLATIRKIDRPTCVLYLQGPRGTGKSMIWEGLSRLWQSHAAVPYDTLSANFDGQLAESLLIVADEKMSDHGARRGSPSAIFRTVVTSSQRTIKRKHLPDATLEACFRLIVTANDDDALNLREQLTSESIDAIAERILYITSGTEASEYLRQIGGREHTDAWVQGDQLAQHVLWLEKHRQVKPGNRLLVEGDSESLVGTLTGKVGINRHILVALCRYVDRYEDRRTRSAADRVMGDLGPAYHPHIFIERSTGDLMVNLEALFTRWELLHGRDNRINRDALAKGLRSLSRGRKKRQRVDKKLMWFYRINGEEIIDTSEQLGIGETDKIVARLTVQVPF